MRWMPLTKGGYKDFLASCTGRIPQHYNHSNPEPAHQPAVKAKKEAKVIWTPCSKTGVTMFQRAFRQAKPEHMTMEELVEYSHSLRDFSEIPEATPSHVVDSIKYIVDLYYTWGVAAPLKVDYWLRVRTGVWWV